MLAAVTWVGYAIIQKILLRRLQRGGNYVDVLLDWRTLLSCPFQISTPYLS